MCQKCVRRSKNLGRPTSIREGYIRMLAYQHMQSLTRWASWRTWFDQGSIGREPELDCMCWPVFCEMAANVAIEAAFYQAEKARTERKAGPYNRSRQKAWDRKIVQASL